MNHPLTEKLKSKVDEFKWWRVDSIIRQFLGEKANIIKEMGDVAQFHVDNILGLSDVVDTECSCGASGGTYRYCTVCSKPKPSPVGGWCEHFIPGKVIAIPDGYTGSLNQWAFCPICGTPRPAKPKVCGECGQEVKNA